MSSVCPLLNMPIARLMLKDSVSKQCRSWSDNTDLCWSRSTLVAKFYLEGLVLPVALIYFFLTLVQLKVASLRLTWRIDTEFTVSKTEDKENRKCKPFHPWNGLFHSRIWTCPLIRGFKMGVFSLNQKQNGKWCRSWWDSSLWAISSGSTLFAQVLVLVCQAE